VASDTDEPVVETEDVQQDGEFASVVFVEKGEDVAAVCGRIDAAPTWAVVVHAPNGNRQISSELGMRRLIHHSSESGKVIAIATKSHALASRARSLRVPVARKPHQVRWDAGGRRVLRLGRASIAPPSMGRYVQILVIGGVAAAVLFLIFAVAPSATVTTYPPTETVSEVIAVTASESTKSVNLETFEVPASRVSAERTFTLALKTTGTAQVGTIPAKARVTVANPTTAGGVVAQGTVVFASDFRAFTFDETVTAPAGGSIEAGVTAVAPGVAGNVPARSISGWEAERLRFLTVTNLVPAAGGVSEPRRAVAPNDALALHDLAAALEASAAVAQTLAEARPHDAVFLGTALSDLEIGEPQPAVGTPAEVVLLDVKVTVSALAVVEETLNEVARHVLASSSGAGEFVAGSVRAIETGARQLDTETGTIRTELRVQGELASGVTSEAVRKAVSGKSEDQARSTLQSRYGIQDTEVQLSGWAPRLPRFGSRINVVLAVRETPPSARRDLLNGNPTPAASPTPLTGSGPR